MWLRDPKSATGSASSVGPCSDWGSNYSLTVLQATESHMRTCIRIPSKHRRLDSTPGISQSVSLGYSLRICISNKFQGDAAAGLGPHVEDQRFRWQSQKWPQDNQSFHHHQLYVHVFGCHRSSWELETHLLTSAFCFVGVGGGAGRGQRGNLTSFLELHWTAIHFCSELNGISFFRMYESLISPKSIWGNKWDVFGESS